MTNRNDAPGVPEDPWEAAWRDLVDLRLRVKNIEDVVAAAASADPAAELRLAGRHAAETASLLRRAEAELRTGWAAVAGGGEVEDRPGAPSYR